MSITTYLNKIPRIKCDIDFGVPFIALLGLIFSTWAVDYFYMSIYGPVVYGRWRRGDNMIDPIRKTHYVLAFTTVYLLYFGFKDTNRRYIRLWFNLKAFECLSVFIGVLVFMIRCYCYWPYIFVSILILATGFYLISCVKQGFNELPNAERYSISSKVTQKLDSLSLAEKNIAPPDVTQNCDDTNETKIPIDINNILRTVGFIKFFEFIIVAPALFILIIIHKYNGFYYDIMSLFLLITGLSFLFTIFIIYVYRLMPAYTISKKENIIPEDVDNETSK